MSATEQTDVPHNGTNMIEFSVAELSCLTWILGILPDEIAKRLMYNPSIDIVDVSDLNSADPSGKLFEPNYDVTKLPKHVQIKVTNDGTSDYRPDLLRINFKILRDFLSNSE